MTIELELFQVLVSISIILSGMGIILINYVLSNHSKRMDYIENQLILFNPNNKVKKE
jgi:hypothetical protein